MKGEWQNFNPKVSIIIPVYNGSNYLKEAIDSALNQTYKNIEILVINDGSKDDGATEKIAKSYGNKIKYYSKENGGVATALNLGIKKMTGEYFSWLSHDDKYKPFKVEKQIALVVSLHDKNVIVASNSLALYESGIKKRERINKSTFKYFDIFLSTSAVVGVNGCSLLIPKHALDWANGFKKDLLVTQDYDLWFRLKDNYRFVLLDKYLVVSRRHSQQDSVQKGKILHEEADLLHYNFLNTIAANRFEEYFLKNKTNINYIFKNYLVYKSQGYRRTATMLLKIILSHYYKYNPKKFYNIFNSQLSANIGLKLNGTKDGTELSFFSGHVSVKTNLGEVLIKCDELFPVLANRSAQNVSVKMFNYRNRYISRFVDSIKRDGIYLSGEKVVRSAAKRFK